MHDVPFLYVACICLVKVPSVFVGKCCSGHACIQECYECV